MHAPAAQRGAWDVSTSRPWIARQCSAFMNMQWEVARPCMEEILCTIGCENAWQYAFVCRFLAAA